MQRCTIKKLALFEIKKKEEKKTRSVATRDFQNDPPNGNRTIERTPERTDSDNRVSAAVNRVERTPARV